MANVADGTNPSDAITLKQLDAVDFETMTRDIDLVITYIEQVHNLIQQNSHL